ncbi:hypothetical protein HYW55_06790 [Candidatus Gottesmanbacteria bacterium]|nr:hypothetical protein [Candidatus Gottesmanbacteria bacterium]
MRTKPIRIGLDFDGVVAYNPFRVVRAPWAYFKRNILGIKKLTFFYPQNARQRIFWKILHQSSMFPANGVDHLRALITSKEIEVYLITGRYGFLRDHLYQWLDRHEMSKLFHDIVINKKDEQPHIFKEKAIKKIKPAVFVEDNLDIVEYLNGRTPTKIYWIYNITDRFHPYPYKFPYLLKALKALPKLSP